MKVECYYTYQHLILDPENLGNLPHSPATGQSQESTHIQDFWDFISHQIVIATIANFLVILHAAVDVRRIGSQWRRARRMRGVNRSTIATILVAVILAIKQVEVLIFRRMILGMVLRPMDVVVT